MLRAMVSLALLRGWWDIALLLLPGFLGMLRPAELLKLSRASLVLPSDVLGAFCDFVSVKLVDTKTRRLAGRFQHVKMDELSAKFEKWIDSIRLYERRKDSARIRLSIREDVKISVLEGIVPAELEKHMQLNRSRLQASDFRQLVERDQ